MVKRGSTILLLLLYLAPPGLSGKGRATAEKFLRLAGHGMTFQFEHSLASPDLSGLPAQNCYPTGVYIVHAMGFSHCLFIFPCIRQYDLEVLYRLFDPRESYMTLSDHYMPYDQTKFQLTQS